MLCRFLSIGQVYSLLFAVLVASTAHAQLDWNNDVVVFGTDQNEIEPLLISKRDGQYRAFCLVDGNVVRTRRSQLQGEAWGDFSDRMFASASGFLATGDGQFAYVWHVGTTGLFRIHHDSSAWSNESAIYVIENQLPAYDCDVLTDYEFDPVDTYIHGCCLVQDGTGISRLLYFRSEDRAQSISVVSPVDSLFQIQDSSASVAAAVTWSGENEKIWIALTTDRPGSTGEQIRLYSSGDLGQTWSAPVTPDSSSYAMMGPAMMGHGETIILAYQRRNSASIARDIYMAYSPDNGTTWSEPLQLTDHAFDDVQPTLALSGDQIGLFYARAQTQNDDGQLLFRQSSLTAPWIWETEVNVSSSSEFIITEGYSATGESDGFAAVWSGRIIGGDGDIFFDGSWRGTPVTQPPAIHQPTVSLRANALTGWIEVSNPAGAKGELLLFDILGRAVMRSTLVSGTNILALPSTMPSGTYWLTHRAANTVRIQILR